MTQRPVIVCTTHRGVFFGYDGYGNGYGYGYGYGYGEAS